MVWALLAKVFISASSHRNDWLNCCPNDFTQSPAFMASPEVTLFEAHSSSFITQLVFLVTCYREWMKPWVGGVLSECVLLRWAWPYKGLQDLRWMGNWQSHFPYESDSEMQESVYRGLWIEDSSVCIESSNCCFLILLDVYSLRQLAYRYLLPRLANPSSLCWKKKKKTLKFQVAVVVGMAHHTWPQILCVCLSVYLY